MRTKRLFIGGKLIPCSSLSYKLGVNLNTLNSFTAMVPRHLTEITKGQTAKIYWGKRLDFKGYYEERGVTRDETGVSHIITGRSVGVLANRRNTQRELFLQKDPAEILSLLNQPTGEPFDPSNIVCETLNPFQDTYVWSLNPTTHYETNQWNAVILEVIYGNPDWARTLLEFIMPDDLYDVVWGSAEVLSAKLKTYCNGISVYDPNNHCGTICVFKNTTGWTDETATWNNKPSIEAAETDDIGHPTSEGWYEYDVAADVQDFADAPASNHGWTIKDHDEYAGAEEVIFAMYTIAIDYSAAPSLWPKLELIYRINRAPFADVTASHNAGTAAYAIDKNSDTAWDSDAEQTTDMYWEYDLGSDLVISRVDITQDASEYARNWTVEYSQNHEDWTELDSDINSENPVIAIAFAPVTARYIRIRLTDVFASHWKIQDVIVYTADPNPIFTEGRIMTYGTLVDMRFDFAKRDMSMAEVGSHIGWDAYETFNEEENFINLAVRGRDLSEHIRFVEGINLTVLGFKDSIMGKVNRLKVLGQGEGGEQLRVLKEDAADILANGPFEYVHEEKTMIDSVVMNAFATDLFNKLKDPVISLNGAVYETPNKTVLLTNDKDWDAGTYNDTALSGVGDDASVILIEGEADLIAEFVPAEETDFAMSETVVGNGRGQCVVIAETFDIGSVKLMVSKSGATPNFTLRASVRDTEGAEGSKSPTCNALATSQNTIDSNDIPEYPDYIWATFYFDGEEITAGTRWFGWHLEARTGGYATQPCSSEWTGADDPGNAASGTSLQAGCCSGSAHATYDYPYQIFGEISEVGIPWSIEFLGPYTQGNSLNAEAKGNGVCLHITQSVVIQTVKFHMSKTSNGNFDVKGCIHNVVGTAGVDADADGDFIAQSTNTLTESDIPTYPGPGPDWVTLTFADVPLSPGDYFFGIYIADYTAGSLALNIRYPGEDEGNYSSFYYDPGPPDFTHAIGYGGPSRDVQDPLYQIAGTTSVAASGTWISGIMDARKIRRYDQIMWDPTLPADTTLFLQFKAANSEEDLAAADFEGPTGTDDYFEDPLGEDIPDKWQGLQYFQVKAYLDRADIEVPALNSVTITLGFCIAPGDWVYLKSTDLDIAGSYRVYLIERKDIGPTVMTFGNKSEDLTSLIRSTLLRNMQIWAKTKQTVNARTEVEP